MRYVSSVFTCGFNSAQNRETEKFGVILQGLGTIISRVQAFLLFLLEKLDEILNQHSLVQGEEMRFPSLMREGIFCNEKLANIK